MAVQARTLEFYRQLGIADDVIAGGFRLDRLHLRNRSREIAAVPLGDVGKGISPYPFALSFPQDDHERLLIDRLRAAGHAVEWDTELTGLTQQDDGVRADAPQARRRGAPGPGRTCAAATARTARCGTAWASASRAGRTTSSSTSPTPRRKAAWSDRDITAYVAEKTFCLAFPVRARGHVPVHRPGARGPPGPRRPRVRRPPRGASSR